MKLIVKQGSFPGQGIKAGIPASPERLAPIVLMFLHSQCLEEETVLSFKAPIH